MALLDLETAAQKLGISTEELIEMREKNLIHGYRDGASWKFKEDEVARVKDELEAGGADSGVIPFDDDDDLGSILVSEEELGESVDGAKSSIIGKAGDDSAADSDIQLSASSGSLGGSDLSLSGGSDLGLSDTGAGSDLDLSPGSETGTGSNLELEVGAGTGDLDLVSDLNLGSDPLDLDDDDDLALSDDDDDDLVLGGSGDLGSDVTLGTADTGINLTSPSDSGLSLEEEPLELGSSISSLELPEDDDQLGLEDVDDAMQPDDEFMLSQPDDSDDDDDSGSQVIALEESAAFEDPSTMLGDGEAALLTEDDSLESPMDATAFAEMPGMDDGLADDGMAGMAGADDMGADALGAAMPMPSSHGAPEAPYTILNVLWLLTILMILCVTGMLMMDVVRNMWSWNETAEASTSLTDGIIGALGMDR